MTLQFPRYSKDGKRLDKDDCIPSHFFQLAVAKKYKDLIPTLDPKKAWKLGVLVGSITNPYFMEEDYFTTWNMQVNEITCSFWTKATANQATEECIKEMYPCLEPPTFGEKQ